MLEGRPSILAELQQKGLGPFAVVAQPTCQKAKWPVEAVEFFAALHHGALAPDVVAGDANQCLVGQAAWLGASPLCGLAAEGPGAGRDRELCSHQCLRPYA